MPRLTDDDRQLLLADYHAGVNKNQLSIKYGITPAGVHKICNGIAPKHVDKVNMLVNIDQEMREQSKYELRSVVQQVSQKVSDMAFFRSASLIIAKKALEKVKTEDLSMFDLEKAQGVIGRGKENIYGRTPETAIQINNQPEKEIAPTRPTIDRDEWLKIHGVIHG